MVMRKIRISLPLTGDDNGLILSITDHTAVSILGDSKQVRLQFTTTATRVCLNDIRAVHVDASKWICGDQDNSGVCVDVA
jgi:hypothetical protein